MAPTNTLPFQAANRSPKLTAMPEAAIDGIQVTSADSIPSRVGWSEMGGPG
jgi:hypothetical protein